MKDAFRSTKKNWTPTTGVGRDQPRPYFSNIIRLQDLTKDLEHLGVENRSPSIHVDKSKTVERYLPTSRAPVRRHRRDATVNGRIEACVDWTIDFDWAFEAFHSTGQYAGYTPHSSISVCFSPSVESLLRVFVAVSMVLSWTQFLLILPRWLNRPFPQYEPALVANDRYLQLRPRARLGSMAFEIIHTYLPRDQSGARWNEWKSKVLWWPTVPVGFHPGRGGRKRSRRFFRCTLSAKDRSKASLYEFGGNSIVYRGSEMSDFASSAVGWDGNWGTLSRTWHTWTPAVPLIDWVLRMGLVAREAKNSYL